MGTPQPQKHRTPGNTESSNAYLQQTQWLNHSRISGHHGSRAASSSRLRCRWIQGKTKGMTGPTDASGHAKWEGAREGRHLPPTSRAGHFAEVGTVRVGCIPSRWAPVPEPRHAGGNDFPPGYVMVPGTRRRPPHTSHFMTDRTSRPTRTTRHAGSTRSTCMHTWITLTASWRKTPTAHICGSKYRERRRRWGTCWETTPAYRHFPGLPRNRRGRRARPGQVLRPWVRTPSLQPGHTLPTNVSRGNPFRMTRPSHLQGMHPSPPMFTQHPRRRATRNPPPGGWPRKRRPLHADTRLRTYARNGRPRRPVRTPHSTRHGAVPENETLRRHRWGGPCAPQPRDTPVPQVTHCHQSRNRDANHTRTTQRHLLRMQAPAHRRRPTPVEGQRKGRHPSRMRNRNCTGTSTTTRRRCGSGTSTSHSTNETWNDILWPMSAEAARLYLSQNRLHGPHGRHQPHPARDSPETHRNLNDKYRYPSQRQRTEQWRDLHTHTHLQEHRPDEGTQVHPPIGRQNWLTTATLDDATPRRWLPRPTGPKHSSQPKRKDTCPHQHPTDGPTNQQQTRGTTIVLPSGMHVPKPGEVGARTRAPAYTVNSGGDTNSPSRVWRVETRDGNLSQRPTPARTLHPHHRRMDTRGTLLTRTTCTLEWCICLYDTQHGSTSTWPPCDIHRKTHMHRCWVSRTRWWIILWMGPPCPGLTGSPAAYYYRNWASDRSSIGSTRRRSGYRWGIDTGPCPGSRRMQWRPWPSWPPHPTFWTTRHGRGKRSTLRPSPRRSGGGSTKVPGTHGSGRAPSPGHHTILGIASGTNYSLQLASFVVARRATPTTWEADLVDLPYPTDAHIPPASETALRAMLSTYAQSPSKLDMEAHLRRFNAPSAARVLRWEPESTWPRGQAAPYFPGDDVDWEEQQILSLEPCWVQQWST